MNHWDYLEIFVDLTDRLVARWEGGDIAEIVNQLRENAEEARRYMADEDPDEDDEKEEGGALFENLYTCPRCGEEWADVWDATCDDDCPRCGLRHISPRESRDVPPETGAAEQGEAS